MAAKVLILGAGISGLTTAFLLQKKGFDVTLIEKRQEAGGCMQTVKENDFVFDIGPNSLLDTTPLISRLIEELQLEDQLLRADASGNKRYILRNNQLHALPTSAGAFLKTKLFSTAAKLRLLREPFVGRSKDGYYQSIAQFVERRLGKEFLDYAINPFVAGVYAGKPELLSVASAFPKLYALEEKYGGLFVGAFKSAKERKKRAEKSKQSAGMISFKDGVQTLPRALASHLGEQLVTGAEVLSIAKNKNGYEVQYEKDGQTQSATADVVYLTLPTHASKTLVEPLDAELAKRFAEIYYPPVLVYGMVYKKSDVGRPLDGFGFLIPEKEHKSFLGAVWNSVIFPTRYRPDEATFTLFVGGSRNAALLKQDQDALLKKVRREFEEIMQISANPISENKRFWAQAIPQYNLGYVEHERYFDAFEAQYPGLFLGGNYRGGISVSDCIKNAEPAAEKIENYLTSPKVQ